MQNILIFNETFFHLFELVLHIYFSLGYFICIFKLDKTLFKKQLDVNPNITLNHL